MALQINAHAMVKLLLPLLFLFSQTIHAEQKLRIVGTYSSLAYNEEGGDLIGYEIRVIPTNQGLKGVIQIAEGDAGKIYIVDVLEKIKIVSFEVPLASGMRGKFSGQVTNNGLEGVIAYPSGVNEKVLLKRSVSYWER